MGPEAGSAWLRIIHCAILCAFTIPEVITLVRALPFGGLRWQRL
jgi:hypothetical protein